MEPVQQVAQQATEGMVTEREKAIALHNCVRDRIKFGFTEYFDAATPGDTLARGLGHCNPKSRLMVALFRAVGLESYEHFVAIPNDILKGIFPPSRSWLLALTPELSHGYVEVRVAGVWCAIDSYSVDTALLAAAQARLAQEGRALGYGTRVDATNVWDGQGNAFSQFDQDLMKEDHGRVEDLPAYFHDSRYRHKLLGVRYNTLFKLLGGFGMAPINRQLDRIRTEAEAPVTRVAFHS
jgi:hypothetical protein